MTSELEAFAAALKNVWPLAPAHLKKLPLSIQALSRILTSQRAELRSPYWNSASHTSAYLYYFLPWNLVRLAALLRGLPLSPPGKRGEAEPVLLDAGSGPLALPMALWLAHPEWRHAPLRILATDVARRPLELGAAIFREWAKILRQPAWKIRIEQGPIHHLPHIWLRECSSPQYPWLAAAANALNEIREPARRRCGAAEDGSQMQEDILNAWEPLRKRGAPMLFIEPGTRLGGTKIMKMREIALEQGLGPAAPCVHYQPCPLLNCGKSDFSRTWCHFVFSAQEAPQWLKDLSDKARLYKSSLTLSPLLLEPNFKKSRDNEDKLPCRVISRAFRIGNAVCRYGCAAPGKCLLPDSACLPSGSLTYARALSAAPALDKKSGAVIIEPCAPKRTGPKPGVSRKKSHRQERP